MRLIHHLGNIRRNRKRRARLPSRMPVGLMQDNKAYPASRLTSEARKPRTCITPSMLAVLQRCSTPRATCRHRGSQPNHLALTLCCAVAVRLTCTWVTHPTRRARGSLTSCTCRPSRYKSGSRTGGSDSSRTMRQHVRRIATAHGRHRDQTRLRMPHRRRAASK